MPDRADVARRHGLPAHLADSLHGETPEEWEADAAARAAIMGMLSPRDLNEEPPEPPIEGLAPYEKDIRDYTEEEFAALHESFDRTMRDKLKRDQREEERQAAEANRTPEERFNDASLAALRSDSRARDEALVRALHPPRGEETNDR